MKNGTIPQLSGKIAKDIREGYTGGAVDMFIPEGINIYCYDVNSLYPSQMQSQDMPVGQPSRFEGNIKLIDQNAFGFFYCKIEAPTDIKHPILQTHVNTGNGYRTIAPIGTWEGMLFSEEMINAQKFGYKFEILWGYTFERGNIFKDYVDFLYDLRLQYDKSNPLNYIAKILLNSLYGRFGMDDNFTEARVIHKDYSQDFINKYFDYIESIEDLERYLLIIIRDPKLKDEVEHNVSIGIASAITAYARVHMSQFKNNDSIKLFYTDTDSIYTDSIIDETLIDEKVIGKLKLEHFCKKAIFLTPKVYCLEMTDGTLITKIKGLTKNVDLLFRDFENLLKKDFLLTRTQEKWRRNLEEGKITILEQLYTLKVNENKRKLIYNTNNKLIWLNLI
jgi:DNA polymerase type B, organellar and viral